MKPTPFVLMLVAGAFAMAQSPPPFEGTESDTFQISVNVELVVLQASVRDRDGRTVPDLRAEDFEVLEDGTSQRVRLFRHEDTPVTVGLVIDHSRSMSDKLGDVIAAAQAFVKSSNPSDQMFVVNFNETVSSGLPRKTPFSDNANQLAAAIWGAPAIGMTALNDAIIEALRRLEEGVSDKKVLVVISDGGDNASKANLDRVLKLTQQSNAVIYTIGVFSPDDPDQNPQVLRRLARESGGEAFFPGQLTDTVQICERIAHDIRNQYTIGYTSTHEKRDGAYRKIRLNVQGNRKVTVRTRAGYRTDAGSTPGKNAARK
ncbi:MAG: VWA domain-containing protein [Bryobacteraceae bacterium]